VANLAMTSPLFPRVAIALGNGRTLGITGAHAPDAYIEGARLAVGSGESSSWDKPWLPASALSEGAKLSLDLGNAPNKAWGSAPSSAPPSFSHGAAPAVAFTTPGGSLTVTPGGSTTVLLGVQEASGRSGPPRTVTWHVVPSAGTTISPTSGTLRVVDGRSTTPLVVGETNPGTSAVAIDLDQGSEPLPSLTLDVDATSP
jgi:hypothetical protein